MLIMPMHAHKRVVIICNKLVRLGQSYVFIMTVDTIGEWLKLVPFRTVDSERGGGGGKFWLKKKILAGVPLKVKF